MKLPRILAPLVGGLLTALCGATAYAQDGTNLYVEIEARGVYSSRAVVDGDAIESSGGGASIETGFEWRQGRTAVQFDLGAEIFDYTDESRPRRETLRAVASLSHEVIADVTISVAAGHWEDIVTLESLETDQDAVALDVTYEDRPHRVGLGAQYRKREYAGGRVSTGEGMRFDADYTYRFGSWHFARLDLRAEDIDSDHPRRGYERHTVRASYSVPLDKAKTWRFRPQIEWRSWEYDGRRVLDTGGEPLRKDRYIAPEIGFTYGKTDGLKARLRAAWQFRDSNDRRYREDAPYVDLRLGYRF